MLTRKSVCFNLFFLLAEIIFSQVSVPAELEVKASALCPNQYHQWEVQTNVFVLFCDAAKNKRFVINRSAEVLIEENATSEIPALVISYLIRNYPQMKISKSYLRKETQIQKTGFRVEVGEVDLFFSQAGEFLRYEVRK